MNFTFEQFERIPDSALKAVPMSQGSVQQPGQSQSSQALPSLTDEILKTGSHTEAGNSQSQIPGADPNMPNANKKTLGQMTGDRGGKLATELMNVMIPAIIIFVASRLTYKVDKKILKLSADEKEMITPAWQNVLDSIFIDFNNPWIQLGIVLGIVYVSKTIEAIPEAKKIVKEVTKVEIQEVKTEAINEVKKQESKPTDTKDLVAKYKELYAERAEVLINETKAVRKRGRNEAVKWLTEKKSFERLAENLQKELGLKA